ncbi:DUF2770 domain-containing protein [Escherichia coli]|nr:DUF2770 domain-containing protein [Escherichia coli]
MSRLFIYLVNNVREHLMIYIFLWSIIALVDLIYIVWAE